MFVRRRRRAVPSLEHAPPKSANKQTNKERKRASRLLANEEGFRLRMHEGTNVGWVGLG